MYLTIIIKTPRGNLLKMNQTRLLVYDEVEIQTFVCLISSYKAYMYFVAHCSNRLGISMIAIFAPLLAEFTGTLTYSSYLDVLLSGSGGSLSNTIDNFVSLTSFILW